MDNFLAYFWYWQRGAFKLQILGTSYFHIYSCDRHSSCIWIASYQQQVYSRVTTNSNLPDESSEAVLLRKIFRKKIFDIAVRMYSHIRPECFQIALPWRWPLLLLFARSGKCGNEVLRCLILQLCHQVNLQKFLTVCRGFFQSRFEAVCICYVQLHWFQQPELHRFSCLTYLWWFFHLIDCLDWVFPTGHP